MGAKIFILRINDIFIDMTSKKSTSNLRKKWVHWASLKLRKLCNSKDTIGKVKSNLWIEENIC